MKNEGREMAMAAEAGRQGYEASVISRMQGRAGASAPTGAAGIAHEVMAIDRANVENLLQPGTHTQVTASSTAKQVDAVTMRSGKVVERIQYKDTASAGGIQKTLKQVESGKYTQARLQGTKETAAEFNRLAEPRGISKRMESTGISNRDTRRIGAKATGQLPGVDNIGHVAKNSALFAAGLTAGVEVVKSIENGDSVGECAGHVVSKSAESAVSAAAATAAGEAASIGVGVLLAGTVAGPAAPVIALAAGLAAAAGAGSIAGQLTEGVFDEVGDAVETVVDGVVDAVSDFVSDIGFFFDTLFW